MEAIQSAPRERSLQRIVEQIVRVPMPKVVEEFVDVAVPQIWEEIVEALQLVPQSHCHQQVVDQNTSQERISERNVEHSVDVSVPQVFGGADRRRAHSIGHILERLAVCL